MKAEEIDEYFELAKKQGSFLSLIYVHPVIFFILVFILFAVYALRSHLYILSSKTKAKEKGVFREYVIYIVSHMMMQMLICFLVSYFVIKFCDALFENYIINWIIAPICGVIVAFVVDLKVFMRLEEKYNVFTNPLKKEQSDKKDNNSQSSSDKKENINNITINVGGNHHNADVNTLPVIDISSNEDNTVIPMIGENNEEDMKELMINETTEAAIRSLIEIQKQQGEELRRQSEMLDAIRGSIMNDKKILLKKKIYECINKGYVTPEEDERIRIEYQSYTSLNGNGEIHALYEERFISLPVHN